MGCFYLLEEPDYEPPCSPSYAYEYLIPCYSSRNQDPISFSRMHEEIVQRMEGIQNKIDNPTCTSNQTMGWKEGDLSDCISDSFSRMNEQIFRGMEEIRKEISKNDPFVEGYKKTCKMMADNAYELNCGGKENMGKNPSPCVDCIHEEVCCFNKQVAEDIQKVESIIAKGNRLKVTYQCRDFLPTISQEKHSS